MLFSQGMKNACNDNEPDPWQTFGNPFVHVDLMTKADNDTEPLSFITLAAATANVTRYLATKQNPPEREKRPANNENGDTTENRPDAHSEYVDKRLREITAWERRVSGKN